MFRGVSFVVLLLAGLAAPSAADVRAARDAVYARTTFQRDLPGAAPTPNTAGPREEAPPEASPEPETSGGSDIARVVLWLVIGVVVVVIVVASVVSIARELASRRQRIAPRPSPAVAPDAVAPAAPLPDRLLGDAEAEASAGRFAEAIHRLLLATLAELLRRARVPVHPSWTSREVLARTGLGEGARAALGELVLAVEVSHFGAAVVGAADFARCRERYQAFARVYAP